MPAGYSKRPLLDKLGVKPGTRIALVGLDDTSFRRELSSRVTDIAEGRPRKDSDIIFFLAGTVKDLKRLTPLRGHIKQNGVIWVLWPKGRPALRENDVIQAAKAQGLVDIKVAAFSDVLSALKLVIPLKLREAVDPDG